MDYFTKWIFLQNFGVLQFVNLATTFISNNLNAFGRPVSYSLRFFQDVTRQNTAKISKPYSSENV